MKIIIVEDHTVFRQLLVKLCNEKFTVIGEATNGEEALEICRQKNPDLVIMDIMIPKPDGIEVAEIIHKEKPNLKILGLSGRIDTLTVHRLLKSGILGYVNKLSEPIEVIKEAIKTVAAGKPYFTQQFKQASQDLKHDQSSFHRILSRREIQLFPLFSQGLDNQTIGEQVGLKASTVIWHRRNVMKKLQIHSTTDLMRYGIKHGFWYPVQ